jgi:hypothetical protein
MDPVTLDLFAVAARKREAPPYQHGSDTSLAAAQAIAPAAGTLRARVYQAILALPDGLTDEEGCLLTGMNPSTWRPRRIELLEQGLVRQAGTRLTKSGRSAVVWAAAMGGEG